MKTTFIVASVLLMASPAVAQTCKPVVGSFEAVVVPAGQRHCPTGAELCTAGRVWGGVQGTYEFVMTAQHPSILMGGVPTIIFFTGRSVVSLKSGDRIVGTDTGSIDVLPARGGFASLITMDADGGQMKLRGDFDPAAGTTAGDYVGTLCSR
jgi:hypothetical protein